MKQELVNFTPRGDRNGWLVALEGGDNVPFCIQRVYYIYDTLPGIRRGKHAHRALRQMAVCLRGACRFHMDDGRERQEYHLSRPDCGLLIEPMIWHEMDDFTPDCILLVLASGHYDERDYIRNYSEWRKVLEGR